MELLLSALQQLPEYRALVARLEAGSVAALSGVGQLPRSHMLAALARDLHRPALILCADDQAAQRTQLELAAFLPQAPALLPSREFTFCDASVVSRGWWPPWRPSPCGPCRPPFWTPPPSRSARA